jgi:hypothetical protein
MTEKVEFVSKASKALQDACQEAQKTLALLRHPPNFLPLARGLIFYTAWKGGIGIGIEVRTHAAFCVAMKLRAFVSI